MKKFTVKRLTAFLTVLIIALSLFTACGNEKNEGGGATPTKKPEAAVSPEATPGGEEEKPVGDKTYTISDKTIADSYPAIATDGVEITDEMCEDAIVNEGNLQRLAEVMSRASSGEEITVAYIGGSITDGSVATPQEEKCYAGLTQTWWQYTFQDATINYVNAGVGATDSYIGVHRAAKDVISNNPDVVVVEFSVNDTRQHNQETYESLLRMLLNSESKPAVISLVLCTETSYYQDHYKVANALDVPVISYAKIAQANMADGTWEWSQIGAPDKVHPNNGGHSVIAHLLTYFYNKVLNSINDSSYFTYSVPDETVTLSRYENADILYADEIEAVSMDGYEKTQIYSGLFNQNAWKTTTGGTITFEVEANNIGIIFQKTVGGNGGQFDVYVNGEKATLNPIDANFPGGWGNYAEYIELGKYPDAGKLTVTVQPAEGSTGKELSILALTVS